MRTSRFRVAIALLVLGASRLASQAAAEPLPSRIKQLAPQHPEWNTQGPFRGVLTGDLKALMAGGEKAVAELVIATHAGNCAPTASRPSSSPAAGRTSCVPSPSSATASPRSR